MRTRRSCGGLAPFLALAGWFGAGATAGAQPDLDRILLEARAEWDSGQPGSRERALELLDRTGTPGRASTIWSAALRDPSPAIRMHAIRHFQYVPRVPKEAFPALAKLLEDPQAEMRDAAVWALAQHGRQGAGSIDALVRAVKAGPDRRCPMAAFALASIGRPAAPAVIGLLKSNDRSLRRAGIEGLQHVAHAGQWHQPGSIAGFLEPQLMAMVDDPDPAVRAALASLLVATRGDSPRWLSALTTLLRDPDVTVRLAAVTAIGQYARLPIGLRPAFLPLLRDREPRIRLAAAVAIPPEALGNRSILERLVEALHDPDEALRAAVAEKLGALDASARMVESQPGQIRIVRTTGVLTRCPTAGPVLRAALDDPNARVRAAAAHLLPDFPDQARAALPRLLERLTDPDPTVRGAAAEALGSLGPAARVAVRAMLAMLAATDDATEEGLAASTQAVRALVAIGGDARSKMLRVLFGQLNSADEDVRQRARQIAAGLGPAIRADLFRALADPRSPRGLQREAVVLLRSMLETRQDLLRMFEPGRIESTVLAARPALRALARDEDPEVELAALWLLGQIDPANADAPDRFFEHVRSGRAADEGDEIWHEPFLRPAMTPMLVQGLRAPEPEVRLAAVKILSDMAERTDEVVGARDDAEWKPRAARELLASLGDPDVRVRWAAAEALGILHVEAERVVPRLTAMIGTGTARVPREAAALRTFDELGQPYLLGRSKKDGDPLRIAAIQGLAGFGAEAAPAVPGLIWALRDPDPRVRWFAAEALGQVGPGAKAAVPALIEGLRSRDLAPGANEPDESIGDGPIRLVAAIVLGQVGPGAKAAVPDLIAAVSGPDSRVRSEAAQALGRIGLDAKVSVPVLLRLAVSGPDGPVVDTAGEVLAGIGPPAIPELVAALRDADPRIRQAALEVLGEMEDKKAVPVPVIARRLLDRDANVRGAAANVLGSIGRRPETLAAIPWLIVALRDDDPDVAQAAGQGLDAIGGPVLIRLLALWGVDCRPPDEPGLR